MSAADAWAAATAGAALFDLSDRPRLSASGRDAARFLHGQCSNDVNGLAPWGGCRAFILDAHARPFAQVRILRRAEDYLVIGPAARAGDLLGRLDRMLIGDRCVLTDLAPDTALFHLAGPRAADCLAAAGLPAEAGEAGGITRAPSARTPEGGVDLLCPAALAPGLRNRLLRSGAAAGDAQTLEILRVEAGLPACGRDYDETLILPELLQDATISRTKGCYIGQETVERVRSRGKVNKRLCGVKFAGDAAPAPGPLTASGAECGRLTSAVSSPRRGVIGLAMIRAEIPEGATVECGGIRGTVVPLPFG